MIRDWLWPFSSGRGKARAKSRPAGGDGAVADSGTLVRDAEDRGRPTRPSNESGEAWEKIALDLYDADEAEELRDFLAADRLEVRADPHFREQLRRKLWAIVSGDEEERSE